MGGRPLTALSIAAFPEKDFPLEWAAAIVRGGQRKLREAGLRAARRPHRARSRDQVRLRDHRPRGPRRRCSPTPAAAPGDVARADQAAGHRRHRHRAQGGQAPEAAVARGHALDGHAQPRSRPRWPRRHGVRAATDITGFGLAGHAAGRRAREPAHARDRAGDLPLLPGRARARRRASSPAASRRTAGSSSRSSTYAAAAGRGAAGAALRPADLGRPAPPRPGGERRTALLAELPQRARHRPRARRRRPPARRRLEARDDLRRWSADRVLTCGVSRSKAPRHGSALDHQPWPEPPCRARLPDRTPTVPREAAADGPARRYARALLDVALEKGDAAALREELRRRWPRSAPSTPELRGAARSSRALAGSRRRRVVAALCAGRAPPTCCSACSTCSWSATA